MQFFEKLIGIEFNDRDGKEEAGGVQYTLQGESCIPNINTSNYLLIFEEQIVVESLISAGKNIQQLV